MIVTCPSCQARFQYDEARFQGAPAKRFRCPKCSAEFEVANPLTGPASTVPFKAELPDPSPAAEPETKPSGRTTTRQARGALLAAAGMGADSPEILPPDKRFSLAFLSGPYASTVRVLDKPMTVIGREEGDILTMDPETSRRHAQIQINPDGDVWLTDLGSTNGTFVEGVPVTGVVQLMDRQEFTCGKSTFMLMVRIVDPNGLD